jgi:Family of unknown function (DUF6776)
LASKSSNSVVISFRSPWPLAWLAIASIILMIVVTLASYFLGTWVTSGQYESPSYLKLVERIQALENDLHGFKQKNTELQLLHDIASAQENELQQRLKESFSQQELLQQELALYRDIMAPGDRKGVQVYSFELAPAAVPEQFSYQLILMQNDAKRQLIRGEAEVYIYGKRQGLPIRYSLAELDAQRSQPIPFRFRYFQQIEGALRLPTDFKPNEIKVVAYPSRQKANRITREFPWRVKG